MMSNPATHVALAIVNNTGVAASDPVIAIHAPSGARPTHNPNTKWQAHVNRLVYGYRANNATGIGHSHRVTAFSWVVATIRTARATAQKIATCADRSFPAGISREAVRGLRASIRASISR